MRVHPPSLASRSVNDKQSCRSRHLRSPPDLRRTSTRHYPAARHWCADYSIGSAITTSLIFVPPGRGWHRFCRAVRADWPVECGVDGAGPIPGEPFTDGHSGLDRLRSIAPEIKSTAPDMKCILGVDFFGRFDLLLDIFISFRMDL